VLYASLNREKKEGRRKKREKRGRKKKKKKKKREEGEKKKRIYVIRITTLTPICLTYHNNDKNMSYISHH
jgi:hypothetical protein